MLAWLHWELRHTYIHTYKSIACCMFSRTIILQTTEVRCFTHMLPERSRSWPWLVSCGMLIQPPPSPDTSPCHWQVWIAPSLQSRWKLLHISHVQLQTFALLLSTRQLTLWQPRCTSIGHVAILIQVNFSSVATQSDLTFEVRCYIRPYSGVWNYWHPW